MHQHLSVLFRKMPEETLRGEKVILQRKTFKLLPKWNRLTVLQLKHCVLCTAITDLRSLACKGGELNHFPDTPSKDGYRCGFTRRHSQLSLRQPHAMRSPGQQVSIRTVSVNCAVAVRMISVCIVDGWHCVGERHGEMELGR